MKMLRWLFPLVIVSFQTSAYFSDVPHSYVHSNAIEYVQNQGYVQGYNDNTFRPNQPINRVEFLKILLEANDLNSTYYCVNGANGYSDTDANAWYARYVNDATCLNIVQGYSDGTFRPSESINYAEGAKIINRVYSFNDPEGQTWFSNYLKRLEIEDAVPRDGILPSDNLSRGEMAEIIYQLADTRELNNEVSSDYLDSYTINDPKYGTQTVVTVSGNSRTITTNAIPNHNTGEFPTIGNPNTISAQSDTYTFPLTPNFTGTARETNTPGVAINGVKFEPGTAERVNCSTGEEYRVEAFQDVLNLGLDFSNAHVQPTGAYHYHGIPLELTKSHQSDLMQVGFARDGHLIYYSPNGLYQSSYQLSTTNRTGTDCDYSVPFGPQGISLNGTNPDGTFTSDWVYQAGSGNLDECNGTMINGEYGYVLTKTFPYISRCLKGEFSETRGGGTGRPNGIRPPRR